jgi:glycosyltransferase involved in cell wall biosynthesis
MKIAWIYPDREKDGISIYSRRYVECLRRFADIKTFNIDKLSAQQINEIVRGGFDIIHVQYEPSFFLNKRKDLLKSLAQSTNVPLFISLHEVYDNFPGVFPRKMISGKGPYLFLKKKLYDFRHPAQTLYRRHCKKSFYADKILVHYPFQLAILEQQDIKTQLVEILPHPLKNIEEIADRKKIRSITGTTLHLGSTGFINPNYDYNLLFGVLESLKMPWSFLWIGGLRQDEDQWLMDYIKNGILQRGWQDQFSITGWVSEQEQERLLVSLDLYLALFLNRSSSGSLMSALGAHLAVIATAMPLTYNIAENCKAVLPTSSEPVNIAQSITHLWENPKERLNKLSQAAKYASDNAYSEIAKQLAGLYSAVLKYKK